MTTILAPCDAELIQTACRRAHTGTLSIDRSPGSDAACDTVAMVHLFENDAFLLVKDDSSVNDVINGFSDDITAMVEVIDVAPIQMRERVRALVWLSGTLHEVPAPLQRELAAEIAGDHPDEQLLDVGHGHSLLRMALNSAVIATTVGAGSVDIDAISAAAPDLFWEYEQDWLEHMESHHQDLISELVTRLPEPIRGGRARPLRLDRYGLTFRVEMGEREEDVRIPFARPVSRIPDLSAAIGSLALGAAFGHDC